MPYIDLAESFNEFDELRQLVEQLKYFESDIENSVQEQKLIWGLDRIRVNASRHILFFGEHAHRYVNSNLMRANDIIIQLHEKNMKLGQCLCMSEGAKHLSTIFTHLTDMLHELLFFFRKLGKLAVG